MIILKNILILTIIFNLTLGSHAQTVTDIDGNTYHTISIGPQIWMKENLRTTHFNNGDSIPTTLLATSNGPGEIYQWPYNDDSININIYGRLYTWFAVTDIRNVCPTGWHVPSDTEWISLTNFLGGDSAAGSKMKEIGTTHWTSTDSSVDNSSGFTGLPGGFRGNGSGYINIGFMGLYWSSTAWGSSSFPRAYIFKLQSTNGVFEESVAVGNCGMSVRCINDNPAGTGDLLPEDKIRIFPNPVIDKLTISFEDISNRHVSIYDLAGRIVFQMELRNKSNVVDLNWISKGVYFIRITSMGQNFKRILIKE